MFSPDGRPVRATAQISMTAVPDSPKPTNPTSGGVSGRTSAHARRGRLAGLDLVPAVRRSRSCGAAIALANGVEDPGRMPPGTRLLVPHARRGDRPVRDRVAAMAEPRAVRQPAADHRRRRAAVRRGAARAGPRHRGHPSAPAGHVRAATSTTPSATCVARARITFGSKVAVGVTKAGDGTQTTVIDGEVTALEQETDATGTWTVVRGYDPTAPALPWPPHPDVPRHDRRRHRPPGRRLPPGSTSAKWTTTGRRTNTSARPT